MTQLLELRTRLISLYQRFDRILIPVLKFILLLIAYIRLDKLLGFGGKSTSILLLLLLSLISALIPIQDALALITVYTAVSLYQVSWIMSVTVIVFALILYCFFIRLIPEYSGVIIAMPLLTGIGFPYILPFGVGLFAGTAGVIPCCIGSFIYYFLVGIKTNISVLEQLSDSQNTLKIYNDVLSSLLGNYPMFASMLAILAVILTMNVVKNIKMDFSFEISVAAGVVTNLLVYIILMLNWELGIELGKLFFITIISGIPVLLASFVYRPLYYAGTERVQFEDDDYYYYVRAVPKLKAAGARVVEKQVINRRTSENEEELEEELDVNE